MFRINATFKSLSHTICVLPLLALALLLVHWCAGIPAALAADERLPGSVAQPHQIVLSTTTTIAAGDTQWDGQDLVISGTVVTIDGHHSYASLQVLNGGMLT
ncbi:MAG: hypothetical protein JW850_16965, partial [Thermoflexales bacterium]|nr:hypothetical protein [Thermoflexales bacterium]